MEVYNMDKKIHKAANKFIKAVKSKIDFEHVEEYANSIGYKIIFFNTPDGDTELMRFNKSKDEINDDALTYCGTAQIIFLNANVSSENKLYLLLHEIGHIVLGHIGDGKLFLRNKTLIDIEADAFVHAVLNPSKSKVPLFVLSAILCFSLVMTIANPGDSKVVPTDAQVPTSITYAQSTPNDVVYVTPSGNKYHLPDCRYTKNKDCTTFTRSDAEKKYTPCSVCRP